jgi:hypothetical protein
VEAGGVNFTPQETILKTTALIGAAGNDYFFVAAVHDGHRALYRSAAVAFFVFVLVAGRVLSEGALRSTFVNMDALDWRLL